MHATRIIIVGQGLAGTAVAWTLLKRGVDFIVVDNEHRHSSSRIAAGLVTPVTGKRALPSWGWAAAWDLARRFYGQVEVDTQSRFWRVQPALRLYDSEAERHQVETRIFSFADEIATHGDRQAFHLEASFPPESSSRRGYDQSYGGLWMNQAARLDVASYLEHSKQAFIRKGRYRTCNLRLDEDVELTVERIMLPRLDVCCQSMIFCQGYTPEPSRWFPRLPLVPAQGDILTAEIAGLDLDHPLHRNVWMTPFNLYRGDAFDHRYLVGSNYRWSPIDGLPSQEARKEIVAKWTVWFRLPFEVIDQRSAVRPSSYDQKPLLGPSPIDDRFWVLNGLGAKGTLLAPWCAEQLVECLLTSTDVPSSLRWSRRRR